MRVISQTAVSSGLFVIPAGCLLGCAQPGSMREPLLNKQGRPGVDEHQLHVL